MGIGSSHTAGVEGRSIDRGSVRGGSADPGRKVLLRGFNTTTLLDWPGQPVAPLDETDLDLIQRSGFNVVRLAIAWSRLEPVRGQVDSDYIDHITRTVDLLNRHGMYVVLDLHVTLAWSPRFGGAGAPSWATLALVPDVRWGHAGDWTEAASPAVLGANAYFWISSDWQSDFKTIWKALALRFRDVSGVAGYDIYNEPNSAPLLPGVFETDSMWPFYARLIQTVAEADPNHLFIVEAPLILTPPRLGIGPRMLHLRSPQLVYSPHTYVGSVVAPLFSDDPDSVMRSIQAEAKDAQQIRAPAWWGEFGVDTGKAFALGWTDHALDAFDDLQAGWAWWQWRQDWGWGVRNDSGEFVNMDFLHHLARPFLAAAPAGVQGSRGDGVHGSVKLSVSSDHSDQPVSVSWSAATLRAPVAEGSCVASAVWRPEDARLDLTLVQGAGCTVRISAPRGMSL